MDGLFSLLLFAGVFYLMMRFGCGAHMVHGQHKGHGGHDAGGATHVDPVCGMKVDVSEGYGKMHDGVLYRFCSRKCLDQFEEAPEKYAAPHHEHEGGTA